MHKDDLMTPLERMDAYFSGKEFDRIPALPFLDSVVVKVVGMTHREKRSSAKNQAKAQILAYEKLGQDDMSIEYGLHGIGQACGTKLSNPENAVPAIVEHKLKDLKDLDKELSLDCVLLENDPWFKLNYDAYQICMEKYGHEIGASLSLPGPMTAAGSLYPVDKLMKAIKREPENVHKLLRFSTDAIKLVLDELMKVGAGIFICDPIASYELIKQSVYKEFVFPYTKEIFDFVHSKEKTAGYHICGNTNPITLDMLDTGCDILSVDTKVKISDAVRLGGSRAVIVGNVNPIDTMLLGNSQDVHRDVRQCILDGFESPQGFIVSTGCDIPVDSPIENVYAFMEAARKYGNYNYLQNLKNETL